MNDELKSLEEEKTRLEKQKESIIQQKNRLSEISSMAHIHFHKADDLMEKIQFTMRNSESRGLFHSLGEELSQNTRNAKAYLKNQEEELQLQEACINKTLDVVDEDRKRIAAKRGRKDEY